MALGTLIETAIDKPNGNRSNDNHNNLNERTSNFRRNLINDHKIRLKQGVRRTKKERILSIH